MSDDHIPIDDIFLVASFARAAEKLNGLEDHIDPIKDPDQRGLFVTDILDATDFDSSQKDLMRDHVHGLLSGTWYLMRESDFEQMRRDQKRAMIDFYKSAIISSAHKAMADKGIVGQESLNAVISPKFQAE